MTCMIGMNLFMTDFISKIFYCMLIDPQNVRKIIVLCKVTPDDGQGQERARCMATHQLASLSRSNKCIKRGQK